jgi:hypothetical protein
MSKNEFITNELNQLEFYRYVDLHCLIANKRYIGFECNQEYLNIALEKFEK